MSTSKVSVKKGSIAGKYLKRTSDIIGNATDSYFAEAIPTIHSIHKDIGGNLKIFQAAGGPGQIIPKIRQLSIQSGFRKLNQWFIGEEGELQSDEANLSYDVPVDEEDGQESASIAERQITAGDRQASQISRTVLATTHKLVEAQISATANILTGIEHVGAAMTSGFDSVNETLGKLLEVTTANSAAMIEVTAGLSGESTAPINEKGKFGIDAYKKMVSQNLRNSGPIGSLQIAKGMADGGMLTSDKVIGDMLKRLVDKINPNLKKNLQGFDETANDLMVSSLIKLGNRAGGSGLAGIFGKIFGIKTERDQGSSKRADLEVKPIQFNSMTQESAVSVIPGYLQRILKQLGGGDVNYDYKSRQFRSKASMQREYGSQLAATGTIESSGNRVKHAFSGNYNKPELRDMVFDLMMEDFSVIGSAAAEEKLKKSSSQDIIASLLANIPNAKDLKKINASDIASLEADLDKVKADARASSELLTQGSTETLGRNRRLHSLQQDNDTFYRDPSVSKDTGRDRNAILRKYGIDPNAEASVNLNQSSQVTGGVDYTNMALYEIHKLLAKGINVYQTGSNDKKHRQTEPFAHAELNPPVTYKAKAGKKPKISSIMSGEDQGNHRSEEDAPTNEDGSRVSIKQDGVKVWGKANGKDFVQALFSGDPNRIKDVTARVFGDASDFAGEKIKKFFGEKDKATNFTGWLKESIFGKTEQDADGKDVKKSRGILGSLDEYIFGEGGVKGITGRVKESTSKWFKSVSGYFNDGKEEQDKSQEGAQVKRNKIFGASMGMVTGLGFLGGPLGLIAGGLVGNALAGTEGIGSKIKDVLFGKDYTDKKGKEKHKLGILERVVNSVTDPLRYQLGKTATALGAMAKKNILGPLANLGEAIKDRVANAAATKAGKVFGWIFDKGSTIIQKFMMAPFHLLGTAGAATRGAAGAASGMFGGAINFLSDRVAVTDKAKDKLQSNRDKYSADYDATVSGSEYYGHGGQRAWIKKQNELRKSKGGMRGLMDEKLNADIETTAKLTGELVDEARAANERDAEVGARVSDLATAGLQAGSIYTHDEGIHTRLDTIIATLKGSTERAEEDQFANAMASTGVTAAMSGKFSKDDAKDAASITELASKDGVSKPSVVAKMDSIFKRSVEEGKENDDGDVKEEKKESILSTILKGAMGLFSSKGGLLALAAGALALFNENIRGFLGDLLSGIVKNLGTGLANLGEWIWNGGDQKNAIMNAITSPADVRTPSMLNYGVPGASLYHVDTDAAGNDVRNQTMSHAKDLALTSPLQLGAMNTLRFNAAQQGADTARMRAGLAGSQSDTAAAKYSTQADKMQANANKLAGGSKAGNVAGRAIGNVGAGMAVGVVAGKAAGSLTTNLLEHAGVSEEWAARGGRAAETITQTVGTAKAVSGKGVLGFVKEKLLWLLDKLVEAVKGSKAFGKVATAVTEKFDKVAGMVTEKLLQPFLGKIAAILAKMGIETTAAGLTLGLSVAMTAGVGAITGGCNTENLFGVLPGQADAKMTTIATFLGTIFGLPYVSLIEVLDLIIDPVFGKGIRQLLAELLYVGVSLNPEEAQAKLDGLTANFQLELDDYNSKYGTDIDASTYNDMINKGLGSKILNGGTRMTADGHSMTDEAGAIVTTGGMTGLISGRGGYAHDAEGNVLRGDDGAAIAGIDEHGRRTFASKLDENGNEMFDENGNPIEDKKLGNYVGDAWHAASGFLFGEKTYQTDETGEVLYDKEGNPILDHQDQNVFGKIGTAFGNARDSVGEFFFGKKEPDPDEGASLSDADGKPIKASAGGLMGQLNESFRSKLTSIGKGLTEINESGYELDEAGNPILDENGQKVPKGGFGNMLKRTFGGIGSSLAGTVTGALDAIKEKGLVGAASDGLKSIGSKVGDFVGNLFGGATVAKGNGLVLAGRGADTLERKGKFRQMIQPGRDNLADRYIQKLSPVDTDSIASSASRDTNGKTKNLFFQGNYSNSRHMADSGCGPIAAAFMTSLYGKQLTPMTAATIMTKAQWRDSSGATSIEGIEAVGHQMGVELVTSPPKTDAIVKRLQRGEPIIFLGRSDDPASPYTSSGHYLVATGMDQNGLISVMDPLSKDGKQYKLIDLLNGMESMTYSRRSGLPGLIDEISEDTAGVVVKFKSAANRLRTFAPINTVVDTASRIGSSVINAGKRAINSVTGGIKRLFGRGDGGFGPGDNESIDLLHDFPIYHQGGEAPWADKMYSGINDASQTMAGSACGPTSMAMVLAGATGQHFSPYSAAQFAMENGYRTPDSGTSWAYFDSIAKKYNLKAKQSSFSSDSIDQALAAGKPVIVSGKGSAPFTSKGHFVTVVGKAGDKYLINDPNNKSGEYNSLSGASQMWSFSKPDDSPILGSTAYDLRSPGVTTDATVSSNGDSSGGVLGMVSTAAKSIIQKFYQVFGLDKIGVDNIAEQDRDPESSTPATGSGAIGHIDGPVEYLTTAQVAAIQTKREAKEIIDLKTMKVINFSWAASADYHSDCTPMTPNDTATIKSILHPTGGVNWNDPNVWSWNGRPGVLKLNGRLIACGFHLRPHAMIMGGNPGAPFADKSNDAFHYSSTQKWPLGGHICCYYGDSPGGTQSCNEAAKEAYKMGNAIFKADPSSIGNSSKKGGSSLSSTGDGIGGFGDTSPLNKTFKVTSSFGPRDGGQHNGIDLVPDDHSKEAEVHVTEPGTVAKTGYGDSTGNYVTVNGTDGRLYQFYHLADQSALQPGQKVESGQYIGPMGTTGHSNGPHLHYGIKENGKFIDPATHLGGVTPASSSGASVSGSAVASTSAEDSVMGKGIALIAEAASKIGSKFMSVFGLGTSGGSQLSQTNYGSGSAADLGAFTSVAGDASATVYNFLVAQGCSTAAACGVLGNCRQESGVDPTKKQYNGGPGRGLFQWEGGRRSTLESLASASGKDWSDINVQLAFLWQELNSLDLNNRFKGKNCSSEYYGDIFEKGLVKVGGHGLPGGFEEWKRSTDVKLATSNFEGAYERANTPMMENRWKFAQEFYDRFSKEASAVEPKLTTSPVEGTEPVIPGDDVNGGIGGGDDSYDTTNNRISSTKLNGIDVKRKASMAKRSSGAPTIAHTINRAGPAKSIVDLGVDGKPIKSMAKGKNAGSRTSNFNGYMTSKTSMTGSSFYSDDSIVDPTQSSPDGPDLTFLEQLIGRVLVELQGINENTAGANGYLDGISQKDFGGVSDGSKKLSKALQRKQPSRGANPFPYNAKNVSSVMSIVRPT